MAHTDSSLSASEAPPAAGISAEKATLIGTLVHLWPYIWPGDRADLKMRVVWSVVLLLVAKLATLSVPFTFKWAIDALTGANSAPVQSSNWTLWLIASPLLMTASYGAVRVLMAILTQWRDGIFARVAMHAVRKLAYITFVHMHELSLRFHLERKTGGLTRVLERGRTGIEVIVRMVILQLVPTVVEVTLLMGVLLWQVDWRYVLGTLITVGDFVMVNAMMIKLYMPLNFMGMVYREIKQAIIDIEKMFGVLSRDPEIKDAPDATPLLVTSGNVRFDDVRFAYEPERPILKGLSFEVPAGKTVAIVGPSGAGKSTISRLLFRLYDVSDGRILIDGQDIRKVTQTSLRASIGMVPQDTVLFNDTIRYNIRYGRWDASDAEVEEAAQLAQIDAFIRMAPMGYETQVGERGLKLSGGEKQRVAIARTVLKAPPILVLDEATSALDSHTEREIQEALERVSRNRTSLVIAHRLSTIVSADEIIVLDQGRIAERGTHAQLLASDGLYASMWNRQREAEEAREKLAQIDDENEAPNRAPPPVEDTLVTPAAAE